MHITLEADYAVRIVDYLASCNEIRGANDISLNTKVPIRFAFKILGKLIDEKIVKSYKGAKGGYVLNLPPEKITLRKVIEAVEGPYYISRCLQKEYDCDYTYCKFHAIYEEISMFVRDKLDEFTFDMIK